MTSEELQRLIEIKARINSHKDVMNWEETKHLTNYERGFLECAKLMMPLVKALEKIANTDYRGNRLQESVIAFHALENLKMELGK